MKDNFIFKVAEAIAKGKSEVDLRSIARVSESEIHKEVNFLFDNRDKAVEILRILFSSKVPTNSEFYDKLGAFQSYLGFKPISHKLTGLLFAEACRFLDKDNLQDLLNYLVRDKQVNFFAVVQTLPFFLSEMELSVEFASLWFLSVREKIAADLAGGGFFQGVENYAYTYPVSAVRVLEKYISEGLDEAKLHLSAIILGSLRACLYEGRFEEEIIKQWDRILANSPRIELRLCYYRSWIIPFRRGLISVKQLEQRLSEMIQGSQDEVTEAFNVLHRCFMNNLENESFIDFSLRWLDHNASGRISDLAKYSVVHSLFMLSDSIKNKLVDVNAINKLIIKIQPIPLNNIGTWNELEYYLVDRLHEDSNAFADFLRLFIEANSDGLLGQFENRYSYLQSEMGKSNISWFVADLMFSNTDVQRRLGNILFQKIKFSSLPEENREKLERLDERRLSLGFWEFVRRPHVLGNDVSKFLLMIEPRFRSASQELQEDIKHEMLMQAINYPGDCLANWKKLPNPSLILKDVIQMAEQYFENLEKVINSPVNSFTFPEFDQAAEKGKREYSKKISEGVEEKSIFSKLAKHVDIIYGEKWSAMFQDKMGEPTDFKEFSHTIEFPRLEEIDPEGSTIRRVQAAIRLKNIKDRNVF